MLPIDEVEAGMVLAADVELGGRPLLRAGVPVRPYHLRRLFELGVHTLYVRAHGEPPVDGERPRPLLAQATRQAAFRVVRAQMRRVERGHTIVERPVLRVVRDVLEDVLAHPGVLDELDAVRAVHDVLFAHSVSVAAMAIFLAIHCGWGRDDLMALGVGALLHDAGKVRLTRPLWLLPRKLTPAEYRHLQEHARLGYEALRARPAFDTRSAHVAWQHHERWDATGYPRGLRGDAIHPFARLVAVVDVFDALTTDRPYRAAWRRDQALEYIAEQAGRAFDPAMVRRFLARVAPYPVGLSVRLNTGELARVIRLSPNLPARPVVVVDDGAAPRLIDLGRDMTRRIVGPARGV